MLDQPAAQLPLAQRTNPAILRRGSPRAAPGRWRGFRRRRHLAVTKAILQSGVAYVGGYQGAPVSHLVDCWSNRGPARRARRASRNLHQRSVGRRLLGASINYPLRGCVTWKSIVGTNVAADALSNLASPGVIGGALIVVGEDYGEGASIIQERAHAYALKSSIWLMDPRPNLPAIVRCTGEGFDLSEATNTPVMMELRIRACHVTGEFAKEDEPPPASANRGLANPAAHDYESISDPPSTYAHEKTRSRSRSRGAAFRRRAWPEQFLPADAPNSVSSCSGMTTCCCTASTGSRLKARSDLGLERHPSAGAEQPLTSGGASAPSLSSEAARLHRTGGPRDPCKRRRRHAGLRQGNAADGGRVHPPRFLTDGLLKFFAHSATTSTFKLRSVRAARAGRAEAKRRRAVAATAATGSRRLPRAPGLPAISCSSAGRQVPYPTTSPAIPSRPGAFDLGTRSWLRHVVRRRGPVAPMMEKRTISAMGDAASPHGLPNGVASAMFNRGDWAPVDDRNG